MQRHRFLAPESGTVLELSWRRRTRTPRQRIRSLARTVLIGPDPMDLPRTAVDQEAFTNTLNHVYNDPRAAAERFRELGYDVTVVAVTTGPNLIEAGE